MCNRVHHLPSPDVMLLPINYAVQDIVKNISTEEQGNIGEQLEVPMCGVCDTNPATTVCIDCDPGNHFRFCYACDREEHTRPFGPAQRHKRFPIDKAPVPPSSSFCSRHAMVNATLYSESLCEFACQMCQMDEDWQSRAANFDLVPEVNKTLRIKVQKLTKYTSDMTKRMGESKLNLETIMNDLEPGSMAVKANITRTFSRCVEVLQERQRTLLANVEVEVSWFISLCMYLLCIFIRWYTDTRTRMHTSGFPYK